ncbi:MAG: glycosyltransferase family 2 protein [Peptococcaceae bacterium]|nr:glycosyltransferase family 2 protein [Peptococcaceae bacterium]
MDTFEFIEVMGLKQKKQPVCSIILPVYNSERYLNRTITSVLQQTMPDFELLAIDDCSTDNSLQMLYRWAEKDSRIQVIRNQKNQGVADTRNRGIHLAQGQHIAFLDSDDGWHNDKLHQQIAWMEQQQCDFSCTAYEMVNDDGQHIKTRMMRHQKIMMEDLLKENYICCSSAVIRSEVARAHTMDGTYNHEDYVYWLELLQSGAKGCVLNQCLTRYRLAQTGRSANKWKAAQGRWEVYRRYLGYGMLRSGWYFVQYAVNGWKKYRKGK